VRSRGFLFGLVVLVILGLFAWHEVRKDRETGKLGTNQEIFPYAASRVQEFRVVFDGTTTVVLRRGDDRSWQVVEGPEGTDPSFAADFLGAWSRIRYLDTVEEEPAEESLSRYGLRPPRLLVEARLAPDAEGKLPERQPRLELGGAAPLQPSVYARVDGFPRVVLVSPSASDLYEGVGRELIGQEPVELPDVRTAPGEGGPH